MIILLEGGNSIDRVEWCMFPSYALYFLYLDIIDVFLCFGKGSKVYLHVLILILTIF